MAALLLVLMMINFGDKAVLGLAAGGLQEDLGITPSQYGTIASGFFVLFSVSALAVGFISDHFKTKSVLLVLALIWAATLFPIIIAPSFLVLLVSRVILGAAEGPAFGVANHAVQKWFSDANRNVPAAMMSLGPSLGVIVTAPTLTWLMVHYGWRSMFIALLVVGLVWTAVWILVGREGPIGSGNDNGSAATPDPGTTRTAEPAAPTDTPIAAPTTPVAIPSTWRVLATGTWIGCALSVFAAYWSLALLLSWLPPYLINGAGYTTSETGFLTTLPWLAGALAVVAQGLFTQWLMHRGVSARWARGALGGTVMIIAGVCMWAFVQVPPSPLKLVLMTLGLGISGVIFTVATTACGQIAPAERRGAVLGAFVAFYSLAGVIAPFITGRLVGAAGSAPVDGYNQVFTITAAIVIAGGVLAVLLIRPERDAARIRAGAVPVSR